MIKNKKADGNWIVSDEIFWIVFTVILGFSAIFYSIMLLSVGEGTSRIRADIENNFLIDGFLKSDSCFALHDDSIKRTYSSILDYKKFTDAQLNSCMNGLDSEKPAFKLSLIPSDQIISSPPIKTSNWNENMPVAKKLTKKLQIFYLSNHYNGEMQIEMQNIK